MGPGRGLGQFMLEFEVLTAAGVLKELAGSFSKVMNESETEEAAEKGVRTRRPADLRQGQEFGGAPVKDRPVLKEQNEDRHTEGSHMLAFFTEVTSSEAMEKSRQSTRRKQEMSLA